MSPLPPLQVIRDSAQAAALLQPTRQRMLDMLTEPDSAAGVARRLSAPRQQINYHIRELEKQGFLTQVEERKKGNCVERLLRATAQRYVVSPEALGKLGEPPADLGDRFSAATLVAAAVRTIREVAILGFRAARAGKRLATLSLEVDVRFRSPEDRHAFFEELATALAALAAKYHDEQATDGRLFRVAVGSHPVITKVEPDRRESAFLA